MKFSNAVFLISVFLLIALATAACASGESQVTMAPLSALPAAVQSAPARVREAYQFAVANPDALKNVPCYCGCGAIGHTSNYACYVKDARLDGTLEFDEHALGCSICVDISQDVLRLTREGKDPKAIRAFIVNTYSKFGPSNQ